MGPLPAAAGCDCQICRPEDTYDEADRKTIETVVEFGWQVILVSGETGPSFAYTVGLGHRMGHPDLLMSGLDPQVMHNALNNVAQRVMDGRGLAPGDVLEDVLAGVPVVIERMAQEHANKTATWSGWFHRHRPDALVIVWPSSGFAVFPWQPGAPAVLDEAQPPAWRVPIVHTGGVGVDPQWTFPIPPDRRVFSCSHVVEYGGLIRWVARERDDTRGEDWTFLCGDGEHEIAEQRVCHLSHLIRSAPSLRQLSRLELDEEASRTDADSDWDIRSQL